MTTVAVVCTTINDGGFLDAYAKELAADADRVTMYVIPDRKTPKGLWAAADAARASGLDVRCPDVATQEAFLGSAGAAGMFPLDSDGRRNIGYLMAYQSGADVMITIDDDNLPTLGWLAEHEVVTIPAVHHTVSSSTGFWNPCSLLANRYQPYVYARGFPYSHRWEDLAMDYDQGPCQVAVNAGLWIGDPDVDAITRLAARPVTTELLGSLVLDRGTWAPVNSQNTAVRREVIPAYAYFEGTKRFADIWQGYFAQACAQALGHHVRFGAPVSDCAVRNDHDLLRDLSLEYDGIMMLDKVLPWLTEVKLTGSTYTEVYECLWRELCEFIAVGSAGVLSKEQRKILLDVSVRMRQWARVCKVLA